MLSRPATHALCSIPLPAARLLALLGGTALALSGLQLSAQALNQPAIRPYRTIETQQIRPNVQVIIDRSGSMSWAMNGAALAVTEGTGQWVCGTTAASGSACPSGRQRWRWETPSRMAILKNVLGNSVNIRDFIPATSIPTTSCGSGTTNATLCGGFASPILPPIIPPAALIDANTPKINVGMENFSGGSATQQVLMDAGPVANACALPTREAARIDAFLRAAGSAATTVCAQSITPFSPGGATSTQGALNLSRMVHNAVQFGAAQPAADICPLGTSYTHPILPAPAVGADPQRSCNRPLFNMLVTDGESNQCNPGDTNITYGACTNGRTTPTANSPAVLTNNLYNNGNNQGITDGSAMSVRTFVIGISTDINTPNAINELNQNAFFGRTDAFDPYQLAGLKLTQAFDVAGVAQCQNAAGAVGACSVLNPIPYTLPADPYLRTPTQYVVEEPLNSTGITPAVTCFAAGGVRLCGGTGFQCGHTYYFLATSQAQLKAGIKSAFDAVAAGDYTTETPSIAEAVTAGGINGAQDLIYTASAEFPSYFGHLRAQDLDQCVTATGATVNCADATAIGFRVLWDAGAEMNSTLNPTTSRLIFTAHPNASLNTRPVASGDTVQYMTLTPVNRANLGSLQTIFSSLTCGAAACNAANLTDNVVDFIRGNRGNFPTTAYDVKRPWQLGDIINSAPTVLAPPASFRQSTTANHTTFAVQYSSRRPLLLVGASDGMIHAFDAGFGFEVWAFIPPDALPNLVQMYNNYFTSGGALTMGQTTETDQHIFGVASAINVADVDMNAPDATVNAGASQPASQWRTIAVSGMGKGGTAVFALDVTSSFTGRTYKGTTLVDDPIVAAYKSTTLSPGNAGAPFKLLWYKNAGSPGFDGLGNTWSSPAVSLDSYAITAPSTPLPTTITGRWIVSFGSGPAPDTVSCPLPGPCPPQPTLATPVGNVGYTRGVKVYTLNARDGGFISPATGIQLGSSDAGALMAATLKANNTTYSTSNINFADQSIDKIYQASTHGRVWEIDATNPNAALWTNATIFDDSTQPVYNSPAIGFYKDAYNTAAGSAIYRRISMHAWASGDFTESSPAINNLLCGTAGQPVCFNQRLFISLNDYQPLATELDPAPLSLIGRSNFTFNLAGMTYQLSGTNTTTRTFTPHARILGSPSIFIPVILNESDTAVKIWPKARDISILFTAYDPTQGGCIGESAFIVFKPFGANDSAVSGGGSYNAPTKSYAQLAASGVASSPIVYKGQIIMNVSSKYSFAAARIAGRDVITSVTTADDPILGAWREVF